MPVTNSDEIETRFRSWTNYQQRPNYGVFRMDPDEDIVDAEIVPSATWGKFVGIWHRVSQEHAKRVGVL